MLLGIRPEGKTMVHTLWVNWKSTLPYHHDRNQYNETGWTPADEIKEKQWNLNFLFAFNRRIYPGDSNLAGNPEILPHNIRIKQKTSWNFVENN